ncbi:MAG: TRAP transporter substrate-binding protein [Henriciella sp.]
MSERLSSMTHGRQQMKIYAAGQLGSERDTLELAAFGGIDINRVNLTPLNSIAAETQLPGLPFVFRSIEHMRMACDGPVGQKILASLEPYGLIGLCFYDSGARSIYNTKRAINSPDDLAGLKIRVQNSNLFVAMIEAFGANPTPMNFGEVFQALAQGVIDGAENNWPSFETSRHYEIAHYYTRTEHVMAPEVLVMGAHAWKKLDQKDQEAVMTAARESVSVMRKLWDERVERSRQLIIAAGVNVTELKSKKEFQEKMTPVYEHFLTPALQNLFQDIQDIPDEMD